MIAIDLVIKALSKESSKSDDSSNSQASDHCGSHSDHHDISDSLQKVEDGCPPGPQAKPQESIVACICCSADPVGDLEECQCKCHGR